MTRITLVLLLGFSMLISFSVQASHGNRHDNQHQGGHYNKHQGGHYNKHQRHYSKHHRHHKKHHGHRYYSHNNRHHRHRYDSHYRYGGYPQVYNVPHVSPGARYGYSSGGLVIYYEPRHRGDYRY